MKMNTEDVKQARLGRFFPEDHHKYQRCTFCVMDTTDPCIQFNESGQCNHCLNALHQKNSIMIPGEKGKQILSKLVSDLKAKSKNQQYDAVIGLSGGVDSSYLLYYAVKVLGLRLLAVHVDAGWNSELAVKNIQLLVEKLGIDLHTEVIDWNSVKRLQRAFFKAHLPNQDIPQDHAFFAALYQVARDNNIHYTLHGSNFATESILPVSWGYDAMDWPHIKSVFSKHGEGSLKLYPRIGFIRYQVLDPMLYGFHVIKPLNFIHYSKAEAIETLSRDFGWRYYGVKHGESRFTRYFQNHYLSVKFQYDKRKAHLSSMIVSGQISREKALTELSQPFYADPVLLSDDEEFVRKKMGFQKEEFQKLLSKDKIGHHADYDTSEKLYNIMRKTYRMFKRK